MTPALAGVKSRKFTKEQAARTAKRLGINFSVKRYCFADFHRGMNVELEHRNVTHGSALLTAKIALAHLREHPAYYQYLQKMESKLTKLRRDPAEGGSSPASGGASPERARPARGGISFYCSYLNGRKICWPVRVMRVDAYGWHYVTGLAGRFKGRGFSVVGNEISSYIPSGYKLAPGAKAFVPKEGAEAHRVQLIRNRLAKVPYESSSINSHVSRQQARRWFTEIEKQGRSLYPRTSSDLAWRHYEQDREKALEYIEDGKTQYVLQKLVMMIDLIRGAAERAG